MTTHYLIEPRPKVGSLREAGITVMATVVILVLLSVAKAHWGW